VSVAGIESSGEVIDQLPAGGSASSSSKARGGSETMNRLVSNGSAIAFELADRVALGSYHPPVSRESGRKTPGAGVDAHPGASASLWGSDSGPLGVESSAFGLASLSMGGESAIGTMSQAPLDTDGLGKEQRVGRESSREYIVGLMPGGFPASAKSTEVATPVTSNPRFPRDDERGTSNSQYDLQRSPMRRTTTGAADGRRSRASSRSGSKQGSRTALVGMDGEVGTEPKYRRPMSRAISTEASRVELDPLVRRE